MVVHLSPPQPFIPMLGDEGVVVEVRVGVVDAVDFGELAGAEGFLGIQAPDAFEQPLAAENFVEAGDASGEGICCVEECGVGVKKIRAEQKYN